jgi:hypothetical protein
LVKIMKNNECFTWRSVCISVCMASVTQLGLPYILFPRFALFFIPNICFRADFFQFIEVSEFFSICYILQFLHILMVLKCNKVSVLLSKEVHNYIVFAQVK